MLGSRSNLGSKAESAGGKQRSRIGRSGEVESREITAKRKSTGSGKPKEKTKTKRNGSKLGPTAQRASLHSPLKATHSLPSFGVSSATKRLSLVVESRAGEVKRSGTDREKGKKRLTEQQPKKRIKSKTAGNEKELKIEDLGRTRRPKRLSNSPSKRKSPFLPSPSRKYACKSSFNSLPRSLSPPQSAVVSRPLYSVSLRLDSQKPKEEGKETSPPLHLTDLSASTAPLSDEAQFQSLIREICGNEDCALAIEMKLAYGELAAGSYISPPKPSASECMDLRPSSPPSHPDLPYIGETKAGLEDNFASTCDKNVLESVSSLQDKGKLLPFAAETITDDLMAILVSEIWPMLPILMDSRPQKVLEEGWKVPTDSQSIATYVHFLLKINQQDWSNALQMHECALQWLSEIRANGSRNSENGLISIEKYEELERYRDYEELERAPAALCRLLLESHQIHDRLLFDCVSEGLADYAGLPWGLLGGIDAVEAQLSRRLIGKNEVRMGAVVRTSEDQWDMEISERILKEAREEWRLEDSETQIRMELAEELLGHLAGEALNILKHY
jgi:hypothetical protein